MTVFNLGSEDEIKGGIEREVGKEFGRSYMGPGEVCCRSAVRLDLNG
jgi:hypothetical protein